MARSTTGGMIAVLVAGLSLVAHGCGVGNPSGGEDTAGESAGVELRRMALATAAEDLGFSPDSKYPAVFGVLMDLNIGQDTASVVSFRDGTTSLYTTSEFGVLGGGAHESVRRAAARYLEVAQRYAEESEAVTEFPYPGPGEVYFYLMTYEGVRRCVGGESALGGGSDPAQPLYDAAQGVLTELRQVSGG